MCWFFSALPDVWFMGRRGVLPRETFFVFASSVEMTSNVWRAARYPGDGVKNVGVRLPGGCVGKEWFAISPGESFFDSWADVDGLRVGCASGQNVPKRSIDAFLFVGE